MPNPVYVTYTTTGAKTPISIDFRVQQVQVSYNVEVPGGTTASVTFDYTLDDINNAAVTPLWTSSAAITSTTPGVLNQPVQFVRLNIASISGGPVNFRVLQAANVV